MKLRTLVFRPQISPHDLIASNEEKHPTKTLRFHDLDLVFLGFIKLCAQVKQLSAQMQK